MTFHHRLAEFNQWVSANGYYRAYLNSVMKWDEETFGDFISKHKFPYLANKLYYECASRALLCGRYREYWFLGPSLHVDPHGRLAVVAPFSLKPVEHRNWFIYVDDPSSTVRALPIANRKNDMRDWTRLWQSELPFWPAIGLCLSGDSAFLHPCEIYEGKPQCSSPLHEQCIAERRHCKYIDTFEGVPALASYDEYVRQMDSPPCYSVRLVSIGPHPRKVREAIARDWGLKSQVDYIVKHVPIDFESSMKHFEALVIAKRLKRAGAQVEIINRTFESKCQIQVGSA